jgi:positive regulator of sigma E activity
MMHFWLNKNYLAEYKEVLKKEKVMKRSLLLTLLLPAAILLLSAFIFQDLFLQNPQWLFAVIATVVVWLGFVGLFAYINHQVDDNPYYTQMVLKKRDEVRLRQKMYAETMNGRLG